MAGDKRNTKTTSTKSNQDTISPKPDRDFMVSVSDLGGEFTEETSLAWMLNFAQRTDLLVLKNDDLSRAQREIVAFAVSSGAVAVDAWQKRRTPRQLNAVAQEMREGIQRFIDGRGWRAPIKGQRLIYRAQDSPIIREDQAGDVRESLETDLHTLILWKAQNLMRENYDRIRHCASPECRRWFAVVKRQLFCSEKCSARDRVQRWRAKPANREKLRTRRRQSHQEAMARQQNRPIETVKIQKRESKV
ncbi:MAG: CGNR zinc finger domain-containing protein [Candidatus Binataceae bacterium]